MLTIRTNLLLDEQRHAQIIAEANRQKVSMGEFIRQAIDEKLNQKKQTDEEIIRRRSEALKRIKALRKQMKPLNGITFRELIEDGRYR